MKKFLALILFAGTLSACHTGSPKPNPNYVASDEATITTLVFDDAVYPDTSFKRRELEAYDFDSDRFSKEYINELESRRDSMKRKLDTAKLYVLINDKMFKIDPGYLNEKAAALEKGDRDHNLTTVSTWQREIKIDSVQNQTFSLRNLAFHYHYEYLLKSQAKRIRQHSFVAGIFKMSSIFYNKGKDMAFVHTSFICGGLCGMERDFYLIKKEGKWRIVLNNITMIF